MYAPTKSETIAAILQQMAARALDGSENDAKLVLACTAGKPIVPPVEPDHLDALEWQANQEYVRQQTEFMAASAALECGDESRALQGASVNKRRFEEGRSILVTPGHR